MILFPNAKINLGLRVIERRNDGFHSLETVFLPVNLVDVLEFNESDSNRNTIKITGLIPDDAPENNLVLTVWEKVYEKFEIPHVNIHLHKNIPVGGGLGGGSSDAAFMLMGLNRLFNCNCSKEDLKEMSAAIGSDCPFFIENTSSVGTGRGEVLQSIDLPFKNYRILLVCPGIHISSKEAYSGVTPKTDGKPLRDVIKMPIDTWKNSITNDFESFVFLKYPLIQKIRQDMYDMGAVYASMTGSGSCVFGLFREIKTTETDALFGNFFNTVVGVL